MLPARSETGRRLIHLGSASVPILYLILGHDTGIIFIAVLTVTMIAIEIARIYTTWGRRLYQRFLGAVTRPLEERRPTGATYVFLGALLAAILYTPTIAVLSMLFMSVGDSTAAFVGRRYGRIRIGSKSLEGTTACFLACLLLTLPFELTLPTAIAGAAVAALTELVPRPFWNDNLTIPVFSGAVMTLLIALGL